MKCKGYAKSVIGGREANQDAFLVSDEKQIYAVADGVGGGLHGEVASKMAVDAVANVPEGPGKLREAILAGQDAVYAKAMELIGEALMGTTLTCVRALGNQLELCHVGDSRCYLYSESVLRLITEDHETFDESIRAPVLSSYLGISPDVMPITIQEEMIPVIPGDQIILCSDGLYKQLTENRIVELMEAHQDSVDEMLHFMCAEASTADYSDNITVVYIRVEGGPEAP